MRKLALTATVTVVAAFAGAGPFGASCALAELPEAVARERNRIDAGDYSTNIIATGQAVVYYVYDPEYKKRPIERAAVLDAVKAERPEYIDEARSEFRRRSREFVQNLAIARFVFEEGQYSLAASLYRQALGEMAQQDEGYNELEGLATAGFYGSGRHVEGLRFICEQYRSRPRSSHRFRHQIHAHLRGLATKFGHDYALAALKKLREDPDCRRDDFTAAWIPIHLYDMRWLEQGRLPREAKYGFTETDRTFADRLLAEGTHPFTDYLLFIDGRYEELLERYPQSYVRDLAQLAYARAAPYETAKPLLLEAIEAFPNRRDYAVRLLWKRTFDAGDEAFKETLMREHGDAVFGELHAGGVVFDLGGGLQVRTEVHAQKELTLEMLERIEEYYSGCRDVSARMEAGEVAEVLDRLQESKRVFEETFEEDPGFTGRLRPDSDAEISNFCLVDFDPDEIDHMLRIFGPMARALEANDQEALSEQAVEAKLCGDYRERPDGLGPESRLCARFMASPEEYNLPRVSLHRLAAALFRKLYDADPNTGHRFLYLEALTHRNNKDFEKFHDVLQEYTTYFPEGAFADDAYAEIGWYHLAVRSDLDMAERFFRRVIRFYPNNNAHDNALNWMVILKKAQGAYAEALEYSARLLREVVSQRILGKIAGRHEAMSAAEARFDRARRVYIVGENVWNSDGYGVGGTTLYLREVAGGPSPGERHLTVGDNIELLNGEYLEDSSDFLNRLSALRQSGARTAMIGYTEGGSYWETLTVEVPIADFGVVSSSAPTSPQFVTMDSVDLVGNDIFGADRRGISFGDCVAYCKNVAGCTAVSYVRSKRWCWPKTAADRTVPSPDIVSAVLHAESSGPQQLSGAPTDQIAHNVDIPGGDLTDFGIRNISLAACEAACREDTRCVAYSYVLETQWCWPKKEITQYIQKLGIMSQQVR